MRAPNHVDLKEYRRLRTLALAVGIIELSSVSSLAADVPRVSDPSALSAPVSQVTTAPVTAPRALDMDGRLAENVIITVRALTGSVGVVFRGMTDKRGRVDFTSKVPARVPEAAPGDVADMRAWLHLIVLCGRVSHHALTCSIVRGKMRRVWTSNGILKQRSCSSR